MITFTDEQKAILRSVASQEGFTAACKLAAGWKRMSWTSPKLGRAVRRAIDG